MILLQTALLLLLYGKGQGSRLLSQVTAPESWRLGVPESVYIRAFQQSESRSVNVSVVSYPDKTMTFSSARLRLTPENRFQGAVTLSITAEDSPGEFVYLVVESEGFREEMSIPVSGTTRSLRDQYDKTAIRRRRRQFLLTEEEKMELTSRFSKDVMKQCCRDGITKYEELYSDPNACDNKELNPGKANCYRAFNYCCMSAKNMGIKGAWMGIQGEISPVVIDGGGSTTPIIHSSSSGAPKRFPADRTHEEEEVIRITVTQTTSSGTVNTTFTVKVNPTNDVSVQLSSKMFQTHITVSARTPPTADGNQ